jgi:hypothetical protein
MCEEKIHLFERAAVLVVKFGSLLTTHYSVQFPTVPVLHDFGSMSGTSHLLHAPSASPNATASNTAHSLRMRRPPHAAGSIQESHEDFERLGAALPDGTVRPGFR